MVREDPLLYDDHMSSLDCETFSRLGGTFIVHFLPVLTVKMGNSNFIKFLDRKCPTMGAIFFDMLMKLSFQNFLKFYFASYFNVNVY